MTIVTVILGVALTAGLVAYIGLPELLAILQSSGWGIAAICAFHLATLIFPAMAWRGLADRQRSPALFVLARLVREGMNNLLPIAQIGGEVVAARILTLWNIPTTVAVASIVVDLTVETIAQIVFTAFGLTLLVMIGMGGSNIGWLIAGVGVAAALMIGFVVAQRYGMFRLLETMLEKLAVSRAWPGLGALTGLHDEVANRYRRPGQAILSGVWHFGAWVIGAGEIWIAFHAVDVPITVIQAIAFESLVQAVRSAAFFIPLGLGAQEGGFVAAATLFNIAPEAALAVALIKRARDVVLGVPTILIWQAIEGRRVATTTGPRDMK